VRRAAGFHDHQDRSAVARWAFSPTSKTGFLQTFGTARIAVLLHCGKSLYQCELTNMLQCTSHNALLETGGFCIFGGLLFRPALVPGVRTGSPWETAMRQGWKSVWAFAVHEALRQVGSFELHARNADEGQRAFSWLLFY
jgi:hypothetical protein